MGPVCLGSLDIGMLSVKAIMVIVVGLKFINTVTNKRYAVLFVNASRKSTAKRLKEGEMAYVVLVGQGVARSVKEVFGL